MAEVTTPTVDGAEPEELEAAEPEIPDLERERRLRSTWEGLARTAIGVTLLLVQLNVWYDSNAWLQVFASLLGAYGAVTGVSLLVRGAFGSHVEPSTWISLAWLAILLVFVFLQLAGLFNDLGANFEDTDRPPSFTTDDPLGTDQLGKSILAQSIRGARVSLLVGLGAVGIGLAVGAVIGLVAGFFRGKTEGAFNIVTDSILAFPPLILLFSVVAIFGGDGGTAEVFKITLALAVLSIPTIGRLSRANTLTFAARDFVTAAKAMGASNGRILFREIMPNVALPLASYAFIIVAVVIVAEASLSFLGVGINPITTPTWGNMISEGQDPDILTEDPHIVFVPGVLMFITVLSLNRIGESLRAIWDPREAKL